jgi:pimeloyl-ACP methyl ester carboxylesterase
VSASHSIIRCPRTRHGLNDRSVMLTFRFSSSRARAKRSNSAPTSAASPAPTLVVGGAKDPRCPPVLTHMFADGIRAHLLHLVMFDACGHGPHTEEAGRVMALLRDFIAER